MSQSVDYFVGRHRGELIYVIGTGPSGRVFPHEILDQSVTIGLNQSWRYLHTHYSITLKSHNYQSWLSSVGSADRHDVGTWFIRQSPVNDAPITDGVVRWHATEIKRGNWDVLRSRAPGELFYHGGSQTAAIHLAVLMGARAVILVGIDTCELDGETHTYANSPVKGDRSRFYDKYRGYTRDLRRHVRELWGVPVLSMTPFVGLPDYVEDYRTLKRELKLDTLEANQEP